MKKITYINPIYEAVSNKRYLKEDSNASYLSYIVDKINKLYSEHGFTSTINGDSIIVKFNGSVDLFDLQQFCSWVLNYAREAEERFDDVTYSGDFTVSINTDRSLTLESSQYLPF